MNISDTVKKQLLELQKNEITEHLIYENLSKITKNPDHAEILHKMSQEELKHYTYLYNYTEQKPKASMYKVFLFVFVARFFGLNFGLRYMEKGEALAVELYADLVEIDKHFADILKDEQIHEKETLNMIDENILKNVGSLVLGINDALVELTGALAGLTFALQNTQLIGLVGFITGFAASLSMGCSEYLSTKHEGEKNPLHKGVITGIAYLCTVFILISPYLIITNALYALIVTLLLAVCIIAVFNFYIAVAKDLKFKERFLEMTFISLGVAVINFGIGSVIKQFFNVDL